MAEDSHHDEDYQHKYVAIIGGTLGGIILLIGIIGILANLE